MNVIYFGWRSQGLRKHLLSRRPVRFIQHGSFEAQSSMHSMLLNMPKLYLFYHKYIHEQFVKFEYYICPDGRERGEVFMRTEDSGWWFKVIWGRDWQPFCPRTKGSRRRKTDGSQLHASETKNSNNMVSSKEIRTDKFIVILLYHRVDDLENKWFWKSLKNFNHSQKFSKRTCSNEYTFC